MKPNRIIMTNDKGVADTELTRRAAKKLAEEYHLQLIQIKTKLEQTKLELDEAYVSFNDATDPGLIDESIYRINALDARYSRLLGEAREKNSAVKAAEAASRRKRRAEETI